MLQHVGIEVAPADLDRAVEFFTLLGFAAVEPPPALAEGFSPWLEREGTQVHLMHTERADHAAAATRGGHARTSSEQTPSPACASTASRSSSAANSGTPPEPWRSPPAATGSS